MVSILPFLIHLIIGVDQVDAQRYATYSPKFRAIIESTDTKIIRTSYQAPNMNAYAERFVRSIKMECLDWMIFLGQASLDNAIAEYVEHYQFSSTIIGVLHEVDGFDRVFGHYGGDYHDIME